MMSHICNWEIGFGFMGWVAINHLNPEKLKLHLQNLVSISSLAPTNLIKPTNLYRFPIVLPHLTCSNINFATLEHTP
jgi:hypothetical protein